MIQTFAVAGIAGLLVTVVTWTLWWRSIASTHGAGLPNRNSTAKSQEPSASVDVQQQPSETEVGPAVDEKPAEKSNVEESAQIEGPADLASLPAFEIPKHQNAVPQLAEVHEIPATISSTGISDSPAVRLEPQQRQVIVQPDTGSPQAEGDLPQESPPAIQTELNEFSPEVARRLAGVERLRQEGKLSSAIAETARIYDEVREDKGESERDTQRLGELCSELRRLDELTDRIAEYREEREFFHASVLAHRVLKTETKHYGPEHPKTAECRAWTSSIDEEMKYIAKPWRDLESQIASAVKKNDLKEALAKARALCELMRSTVGSQHTALSAELLRVAEFLERDYRAAEAIPYYEEANRIREKFFGADNYRVKLDQETLADVRRTAKLSRPKQQRIQAIKDRSRLPANNDGATAVLRKVRELTDDSEFLLENLEEQSVTYIRILLNLATNHRKLGDLKNTERTQERVKHLVIQHMGKDHPLYGDLAMRMATTYRSIHDFDNALRYGQEAVVLTRTLYGEESQYHISALNDYAMTLHEIRDFSQEERFHLRSIALNLVVHSENDISLANQYSNLAHARKALGNLKLAREDAEQAIRILKIHSATKSYTYVNVLNLLAVLDRIAGDFESAERRFEEVISIAREVDGPKHPRYAIFLANAAGLFHQQGRLEKAAAMLEEALPILRSQRDDTFSVQSEDQQLLAAQGTMGSFFEYASVATLLKNSDQRIYDELLKWKGAVFRRQGIGALPLRDAAPLDQLALQLDFGRRLSGLMSEMLDHPETVADEFAKLGQLRTQHNAAAREVAFRTSTNGEQAAEFDVHVHAESLPETVAVVDFQKYDHISFASANGTREKLHEVRLLVFVIRRSQPVVMVQLGTMDRIEAALRKWQESLMRGEGRSPPIPEHSPQEVLAELVWRPFEKYLQGADTVIICPDGSLIEMPFAALPGKQPKSYLIEDYGITTIPTPHLLPGILKSRPEPRTDISALLVGGVNFSGNSESSVGETVAMRAAGFQFNPLPGTTREIDEIAELFRQIFPRGSLTMATEELPTEDFVYQTAGKNQYVHLATHGFYAPRSWSSEQQSKEEQQFKQYTEQYLPSLLSGLALAGANRNHASVDDFLAGDFQDDGLLTSLEVAALDLRKVDLAVLSACESTLGQAPFGEGMLGLQRAFQVAGVQSTVTSLWKVDDAATQALMVEFYANLWERRMSKLEALRQAQLTMLNRYDASSKELKARGLTLINPDQKSGTAQRLAPYYWASFVLSGDWR